MVRRRLARDVLYAGLTGFVLATVVTAFTVVATGLPVIIGIDGIILVSLVSIGAGGVAATVSIFGRLDHGSGIESVRPP